MDNLEKIKAGLPGLREQLKDLEKLRLFYQFSFNFYREEAKYVGMWNLNRFVFAFLIC
jgi:hypothetical protein